jgi:hypothetical protein
VCGCPGGSCVLEVDRERLAAAVGCRLGLKD